MDGREYAQKVIDAWFGNAAEVTMPHDALASWSMSPETGAQFGGGDYGAGVVMHKSWHLERDVLFDQVVDDSTFITSYNREQEFIAGPGHDNGLVLDKAKEVTVRIKGREYTHAEREEARKALAAFR